MDIEKFELLGFHMKPLSAEALRQSIIDLVNEYEVTIMPTEVFNERVIELTERHTWTRQEIKLREKHPEVLARRRAAAKAPRTWCEAECTFHKFHLHDGTPVDYDGNPIPVDRPFPARLNDTTPKEN